MKQSIFRKELSATGKNGTFIGSVVASLNYTTKIITGTHAITHDEYAREIGIHKVEGFINKSPWSSNIEIDSEARVLAVSQEMIRSLEKQLYILANHEPEPTFTEKMNKLFE